MAKTKILKRPSAAFHLFETMLLEASGSFQYMTEHLDRLEASAEFLGFTDRSRTSPWRIWQPKLRAPSACDYNSIAMADSVIRLSLAGCWLASCVRLAIAETPVDSGDMFVCHKTSHRTVYDQAVATVPREQNRYSTMVEPAESAIANVVYEIAASSMRLLCLMGCAPGVLRGVLIRKARLSMIL